MCIYFHLLLINEDEKNNRTSKYLWQATAQDTDAVLAVLLHIQCFTRHNSPCVIPFHTVALSTPTTPIHLSPLPALLHFPPTQILSLERASGNHKQP